MLPPRRQKNNRSANMPVRGAHFIVMMPSLSNAARASDTG
jgi:hypothetical protein